MENTLRRCESHAEREFVRGLIDWCHSVGGRFREHSGELWITGGERADGMLPDFFSISPQYSVGRYRLDFQVTAQVSGLGGLRWRYAIEIDGHVWHERTHAEAAAQRRRDRELAREGIFTIRFAAIEVLDARLAVAQELTDMICELEESETLHIEEVIDMEKWRAEHDEVA